MPVDTWTLIMAVATISPATASVYVNGVLNGTALKENTGPTRLDNSLLGSSGTAPIGDQALFDDVAFS